jgi:chemotaxis signal transduction protein
VVLSRLKEVFAEAMDEIRQGARRSLVVIGTSGGTLGVSVDSIEAVVSCADEEIQAPDAIPGSENFPGLIGLLARKQSSQFIQLLDPAQLYPQLIPTARDAITV